MAPSMSPVALRSEVFLCLRGHCYKIMECKPEGGVGKVLCVQLVYRVLTRGCRRCCFPLCSFPRCGGAGGSPSSRGTQGVPLQLLWTEFVPLLIMSRANSSANVWFLRKGFGLDWSSANCLVKAL